MLYSQQQFPVKALGLCSILALLRCYPIQYHVVITLRCPGVVAWKQE